MCVFALLKNEACAMTSSHAGNLIICCRSLFCFLDAYGVYFILRYERDNSAALFGGCFLCLPTTKTYSMYYHGGLVHAGQCILSNHVHTHIIHTPGIDMRTLLNIIAALPLVRLPTAKPCSGVLSTVPLVGWYLLSLGLLNSNVSSIHQ